MTSKKPAAVGPGWRARYPFQPRATRGRACLTVRDIAKRCQTFHSLAARRARLHSMRARLEENNVMKRRDKMVSKNPTTTLSDALEIYEVRSTWSGRSAVKSRWRRTRPPVIGVGHPPPSRSAALEMGPAPLLFFHLRNASRAWTGAKSFLIPTNMQLLR